MTQTNIADITNSLWRPAAIVLGTPSYPLLVQSDLGNSGTPGDGGTWVPHSATGSHVNGDGVLVTITPWEEGGRELSVWDSAGDFVGQGDGTHGWSGRPGNAVVASDTHVFFDFWQGDGSGRGDHYTSGYTGSGGWWTIRKVSLSTWANESSKWLAGAAIPDGEGWDDSFRVVQDRVEVMTIDASNIYIWYLNGNTEVRDHNLQVTTGTMPSKPSSTHLAAEVDAPFNPTGANYSSIGVGEVIITHGGKTLYGVLFGDIVDLDPDDETIVWGARDQFSVDHNARTWTHTRRTTTAGTNGLTQEEPKFPGYPWVFTDGANRVMVIGGQRGEDGVRTYTWNGGTNRWDYVGSWDDGGNWGYHVTRGGDLWTVTEAGIVKRRAYTGYSGGVPTWAAATTVFDANSLGAGWTEACRLGVNEAGTAVIVSGYDSTYTNNESWGLAGRIAKRYDLDGSWAETWTRVIEFDAEYNKCLWWSGDDHWFVADLGRDVRPNQPRIYAYRASDGVKVHEWDTDADKCGWVDAAHALRARRLADGRYWLAWQDNGWGRSRLAWFNPEALP